MIITPYRQKLQDAFIDLFVDCSDESFGKLIRAIDNIKDTEPMTFRMLLGNKFLAVIFDAIEDEYIFRSTRPAKVG